MTRINFGVIIAVSRDISKSFYWKLHGRPQNSSKGNKSSGKNSKGFQAETDNTNANLGQQESTLFTKEQLEQLVKFMNQIPFSNVAQTGNFLNAFSISSNTYCPWIIDSGATDHDWFVQLILYLHSSFW